MKRIKITKDNFFIKSKADFKKVEKAPEREPDYISYKRGFVNYDEEDGNEDFRVIDGKEYILLAKYEPNNIEADEYGCVTDLFLIVDKKINFDGDIIGYYYLDKDVVSSTYWYTDEGVYRESDHWGQCRNCYWTLDGDDEVEERVVGFCRWEDFDGGIEIDSVGFYRTRDGKKARVDFIYKDGDFPVVGTVYFPEADRWVEESWTINGSLFPGEEYYFDIVDEWREESVEVDFTL